DLFPVTVEGCGVELEEAGEAEHRPVEPGWGEADPGLPLALLDAVGDAQGYLGVPESNAGQSGSGGDSCRRIGQIEADSSRYIFGENGIVSPRIEKPLREPGTGRADDGNGN